MAITVQPTITNTPKEELFYDNPDHNWSRGHAVWAAGPAVRPLAGSLTEDADASPASARRGLSLREARQLARSARYRFLLCRATADHVRSRLDARRWDGAFRSLP